MADHEHGKMNTDVQEKTFDGFLRLSAYVAVVSIFVLIFAALING
ncbi:MAG: aa3-type cytochrome c oxidase subunit IV [Pseudomonadota bacterium]